MRMNNIPGSAFLPGAHKCGHWTAAGIGASARTGRDATTRSQQNAVQEK
jgi:hypothetical protein